MRKLRSVPRLAALIAAAAMGAGASTGPWRLSPEGRRALDSVAADSLRGHLSFLAADVLGGRVNGTPGLDVAAEYVASQFRRAGLEPIGDDGYFQTAPGAIATPHAEGFRFSVSTPDGPVDIPPEAFQLTTVEPLTLDGVELVRMPPGGTEGLDAVEGRAVVTEIEENPSDLERREARIARQRWMREWRPARPAPIPVIDRGLPSPTG